MTSAYISPFDFARNPSGLEYLSLVNNMTRIGGSGVIAGATTLNIITPGLTTTLNRYDAIYIFDGLNSETIAVTSVIDTLGVETVNCTPLAYSHFVGTPICTDGNLGSLAIAIFSASQYLETICKQNLFLTPYTNEMLALPTMRAAIDNQYALHFRPRHWPITSVSSISITTVPGNAIAYDPTQIFIDSDKQICSLINMLPLSSGSSFSSQYYPTWSIPSRIKEGTVTISYISGFSPIPYDVLEATNLLTSDILAKRQNPVGAPEISSGGRHISSVLRGDNAGESLLFKRAKKILDNYTVQTF